MVISAMEKNKQWKQERGFVELGLGLGAVILKGRASPRGWRREKSEGSKVSGYLCDAFLGVKLLVKEWVFQIATLWS